MRYVSGAVSVIREFNGVQKLYDVGFVLSASKHNLETFDGFKQTNVKMLGYGMQVISYRLRILDGDRAGKEVILKCSKGLKFLGTDGKRCYLTPGRSFTAFYREQGKRISTKVQVVKAEAAVCENQYCYAFEEGTYLIGAGFDPLFLYVSFPPEK